METNTLSERVFNPIEDAVLELGGLAMKVHAVARAAVHIFDEGTLPAYSRNEEFDSREELVSLLEVVSGIGNEFGTWLYERLPTNELAATIQTSTAKMHAVAHAANDLIGRDTVFAATTDPETYDRIERMVSLVEVVLDLAKVAVSHSDELERQLTLASVLSSPAPAPSSAPFPSAAAAAAPAAPSSSAELHLSAQFVVDEACRSCGAAYGMCDASRCQCTCGKDAPDATTH